MPFGFSIFGGSVPFNPSTDIPSLAGKVIFITGGNVGLGKETVLQLAQHDPAHIYLSARTEPKALEAINDIQTVVPNCPPITFIQCDLTSLPSVQDAAQRFARQEKRLDILILNAGIMATPPGTTEQGYEIQFGTNHIGHALLTKLLMPTLSATAELPDSDVRVISLSSAGHALAPVSKGIDFAQLKTDMSSSFTMTRYGQSKLANILYIRELAKQYPKITAVSVHPGIVNTNLYQSMTAWSVLGNAVGVAKSRFYTSVQDGAKNQLWACVARRGTEAKGEVKSGGYYTPVGVEDQGSRFAKNQELAKKLWVWTEAELEGYTL
ncbi:putative oxidoreductase [Hyphodiscus hymeniophilus]|uniref:Oxidoreductase n=1 Tax=Hyphodiscus hymeniophilus TaxID=353542 RepID=A0A9P6SQD4_9HELO|nr:putative oxidoreductase [Hyphodiscus hymeniophilus]